jgi:hypothetical protein
VPITGEAVNRGSEVFGDVVNWDFIPKSAISQLTLVPSNPVPDDEFGTHCQSPTPLELACSDPNRPCLIEGIGRLSALVLITESNANRAAHSAGS